jgi:anti-sigma B factor antagonist
MGEAVARFEARTSAEPDRVVVSLAGECDMAAREELTAALRKAIDASSVVVIDAGGLEFLDSSGLHGLITAYHAARDAGRQLFLVNAEGTVADVLEMTGVDHLLSPPPARGNGSDG